MALEHELRFCFMSIIVYYMAATATIDGKLLASPIVQLRFHLCSPTLH